MIKLIRRFAPLRGVQSLRDSRKLVDQHCVVYLCPPDLLHVSTHEWLCTFETKRGARFNPPPSFADKGVANRYREELR